MTSKPIAHRNSAIFNKVAALTFLACAWLPAAYAADPKAAGAPPVPDNWSAFQRSKHPADIALVKEVQKLGGWNACVAWGREARSARFTRRMAALREYLVDMRLINGADLRNATESVPDVGQTTCGVFAVLGLPDKYNQTTRAGGSSVQLVYRSRSIYVYTTGSGSEGIVDAVQH